MNILNILLIFMTTTSLALFIFAIRQRKSNKLIEELVTKGKIENRSKYSGLDVKVRDNEYISRCPSCAEWINLRANKCKYCSTDVEDYNLNLTESMQLIDEADSRAQLERNREENEKWVARREKRESFLRNPLFRASIIVIFIISTYFLVTNIQSTLRYRSATAMPADAYSVMRSWYSVIDSCGFSEGPSKPITKRYEATGNVHLDILLDSDLQTFDWNSDLGKKVNCFSEKALGINVAKQLRSSDYSSLYLRNEYSVFAFPDEKKLIFVWGGNA